MQCHIELGCYAALQIGSTAIAAFGFNGYAPPYDNLGNCKFCRYSTGGSVFAFAGKVRPRPPLPPAAAGWEHTHMDAVSMVGPQPNERP